MKFKNDNEEGSENIEDSISSDNSYDSKNENILFNIDVKLGDNKTAKLYINENDDINKKIKYFCEAYKIKPELEPMIKKFVENKLNQELSTNKNSSTTSSSKQYINCKEKKYETIQSFTKQNYEYFTIEEKKLEEIENESETISDKVGDKNNQKYKTINADINIKTNKNNLRLNANNKKNIKHQKNKLENKNKNNAILNTKKDSKYNNQNILTQNIISNKKININNKLNLNKTNSNNKNNKANNKLTNKQKKINLIHINNKELFKKRPNSEGNKNKSRNEELAGIRLYNNYKNSSYKKNLILQQKHKEKDREFYKFSPDINNNSKKILQKNNNLFYNQKVEDRLINYGNKLNQKILNEKTNIILKDIKDNSFSPKIDSLSRHIAENIKSERINKLTKMKKILVNNNNKNTKNNIKCINLNKPYEKRNKSQGEKKPKNIIDPFISFGKKNNNICKGERNSYIITDNNSDSYNPDKNIFDCLYLESKLDRINKEKKINKQFKDKFTFKPVISNLAKELKKENKETKQEFLERMSSLEKKDKHKNLKKELINNSFIPIITRGPKNVNQREINENLKGYYDKRIFGKKEQLQINEKKNNIEKKKYYLLKTSELIMKMKSEKYKILFELLDSDKDGLISYDKIKLTGINNDILTAITPVLRELYQLKTSFDFKTFSNKLDNLLTQQNIKNIINSS